MGQRLISLFAKTQTLSLFTSRGFHILDGEIPQHRPQRARMWPGLTSIPIRSPLIRQGAACMSRGRWWSHWEKVCTNDPCMLERVRTFHHNWFAVTSNNTSRDMRGEWRGSIITWGVPQTELDPLRVDFETGCVIFEDRGDVALRGEDTGI